MRRKGPRWLTPKVCSNPWRVVRRSVDTPPALFTSTSSRSKRSRMSVAARPTESRSARSSRRPRPDRLPDWSRTRSATAAARWTFRHASTVVAPSRASAEAVASPSPVFAPVMTTTSPAMTSDDAPLLTAAPYPRATPGVFVRPHWVSAFDPLAQRCWRARPSQPSTIPEDRESTSRTQFTSLRTAMGVTTGLAAAYLNRSDAQPKASRMQLRRFALR